MAHLMAVAAGFFVVALGLVGGRRLLLRRAARLTGLQLDELQSQLTGWELRHGARIRDLQQRLTGVEDAVARAEDQARDAATALALLRTDLHRRLERAEHQVELEVLVAEGRIPADHLPRDPSRPWSPNRT